MVDGEDAVEVVEDAVAEVAGAAAVGVEEAEEGSEDAAGAEAGEEAEEDSSNPGIEAPTGYPAKTNKPINQRSNPFSFGFSQMYFQHRISIFIVVNKFDY